MTAGSESKTLGQYNGWVVFFFKLNLVLAPLAITTAVSFAVWINMSIGELKTQQALTAQKLDAFTGAGPRYTPKDAAALNAELRLEMSKTKTETLKEIEAQYPPQWLRDSVDSLSRRVESLEKKIP